MQLHLPQVLYRLAELKARLLIMSFAPLPRLQEWVPYFKETFLEPYYKEHQLASPRDPFSFTRFLADPELAAYHAYGLGRHSMLEAYGAKIIWQYLRWMLQGKPIKMPSQDTLQRGGDFVVGREGRLTLSHVGRDQSERPRVSDILRALQM